jgi:hypothetical protein
MKTMFLTVFFNIKKKFRTKNNLNIHHLIIVKKNIKVILIFIF